MGVEPPIRVVIGSAQGLDIDHLETLEHTQAMSTVVYVCVASPGTDVKDLAPMIPCDGQLWSLTGGWSWVLVQMSNVKSPVSEQLSTVGRDYRKGNQL